MLIVKCLPWRLTLMFLLMQEPPSVLTLQVYLPNFPKVKEPTTNVHLIMGAASSASQDCLKPCGPNHWREFGIDFFGKSSFCFAVQVKLRDAPIGNVFDDEVEEISITGSAWQEGKSIYQNTCITTTPNRKNATS